MEISFIPKHDFLIGIDSDGCAFDTMELKQKECFAWNTIHFWGLKGVSKYAREACDFVNLYSKSRGTNRFPALVEVFQWLQKRPEVLARGYHIEVPAVLVEWIQSESRLGNDALAEYIKTHDDPILRKTLDWSIAVNNAVDMIVGEGVPPFPYVYESLEKMHGKADVLVVSATPQAALVKEWENQKLLPWVDTIFGQEFGTKKESLALARQYPREQTLMIGDAPGDYKAALANQALFFPINPSEEEKSWKRFYEEGLDRFLNKTFAGTYQQELLKEFDSHLPSLPPWKSLP